MKRLFALVAAVVLVDTMFFAALTPLLPEYADELGLSKAAAGVLGGAYAAGCLLGSFPGGWLTGRVGVKATALVGIALLGTSSIVFAFAQTVALLDAARFLQGVGGACMWAGGLAWLIAASPRERRGELIGSALAAAIVGVLLGPVLGGAATVLSPEAVFSSIAVMAAALAVWALGTPAPTAHERPARGAVLAAVRTPAMAAGIWFVAVPAVCAGAISVLVPLRLAHLGASGVAVGAAFLIAAGVEAFVSRFAGVVSDRRGRIAPIRAGLWGAAVTIPLLAAPQAAFLVAVVLIAATVAIALFWAPATALLSDMAESTGLGQGIAFATVNFAWACGELAGQAGGGGLAEASTDLIPYLAISALCLASMAALSSGIARSLAVTAAGRPAPARSVESSG